MNHIPALVALAFASTAVAAPLKSREEISAPLSAHGATCYDTPSVTEVQKAGYKLVFVRVAMRWKDDEVCTDVSEGEHLAIYEEVGEGYRTLKSVGFGNGTTNTILFTAQVASDSRQSPETLLAIELHYSGTGNFIEYELYRLSRSGDLQPVQIKSPATLIQDRLHDGQSIVGPGYDFVDDRISFGMEIANPGESSRFPSGGSAFGTMKLIAARDGLELVPEPQSLQLPSESSRLNRLGLAAYQEKRYDDAVEYYRQAIHWHSRNHEAKSNLGLTYLRLKKLTQAIEASTEVLQTSDAPVGIRAAAAYNLGLAYESLGERDRAAEFYATALRLQPSPARRDAVERLQGRSDTSQSTERKDDQEPQDGGRRKEIGGRQVEVRSVNELPGFRLFSPPQSMRAREIHDLAADGEEGFWLATERGLTWVDPDFQNTSAEIDVPPEFGNSLDRVVASPGRIVATVRRRDPRHPGTTTGVALMNQSLKWQWFVEVRGVSAIQYSGSGVWFSAANTVGWIDARTQTKTTFPVGEDTPRQLEADGEEAWFSMPFGQGGVVHVDRSKNPPLIERFDKAHGLKHLNAEALAIDDIRVWTSHGGFSEVLGLSVIDRRTRTIKTLSKTKNGIPVGGFGLLREGRFLWSAQYENLMRMDVVDETGQVYECASLWNGCRILRMVATEKHVWLLLWPTAIGRFDRH